MLRSIPYHYVRVCTHRGNDIGILRLVAGLVYLPLVVDLLDNVELDLHWGLLRRSTSISSDFLPVFVIVRRIWDRWVWKLDMSNL